MENRDKTKLALMLRTTSFSMEEDRMTKSLMR